MLMRLLPEWFLPLQILIDFIAIGQVVGDGSLVQVSHISRGSLAYTLMSDSATSRRPRLACKRRRGK